MWLRISDFLKLKKKEAKGTPTPEVETPSTTTPKLIKHKAGVIGIGSCSRGSYRMFDVCLNHLDKPYGTTILWQLSVNIALNYNQMCRDVLNTNADWLFILGDDHVFHHDLLTKLLNRNVDIVAPLCLRRSEPFTPTIHETKGKEGNPRVGWEYINGRTGLMEVPACGNAGMLIRRGVLEKMKDYLWFANGTYNPEINTPDIYFCENARSFNYKVYIDLDNVMGHICELAVWPYRDGETSRYSARHLEALKLPQWGNGSNYK